MHQTDKKDLVRVFAQELKRARKRMDMSQSITASRAGMSLRGLQELEAGKTDPQLTTAAALSIALNTPISTLLGRESSAEHIVDIVCALPALNEKQLKSVRVLVNTALQTYTG